VDSSVGDRIGVPAIFLVWLVKVWKYDIPKENRAAVVDAALFFLRPGSFRHALPPSFPRRVSIRFLHGR
jgi:hypothetical protein